jgi:hypothetical protein
LVNIGGGGRCVDGILGSIMVMMLEVARWWEVVDDIVGQYWWWWQVGRWYTWVNNGDVVVGYVVVGRRW